MKNHIHLIPADFDSFNLEDLDNENKNSSEKGVCWLNGSNNGYGSQEFYENDTVYIFFHDTKHITDRILLKANVCETDYNIKNEYLFTEYSKRRLNNKNITNEEKYDYQKYAKGKYKGFYLNEFHAINEIDAHNDVFKCKYKNDVNNNENIGINGVKINQTKRYLDLSTNPNEVNLMCYLEKTKFNRSLKKLISEFKNLMVCYILKSIIFFKKTLIILLEN
jgi:SPP1 family predicted phage head-tail adaptor